MEAKSTKLTIPLMAKRWYFCRIFLNFGRRRQIFDCLPSIAKIPVDTARSIAMSLLSFAKLFTSRRRFESRHGPALARLSIAAGSMYRSFFFSLSLSLPIREPDCRCRNSRNAIHSLSLSLLSSSAVLSPFFRERYGSRPKIDRDRSTLAATLSNEKETISSAKQRSMRDLIATVDLFKRESITAVISFIRDSWKRREN